MQAGSSSEYPLRPVRGNDWLGRRVLVVGMARSGLAAAELLLRAGAKPLLYDQKPPEELPSELKHLYNSGCESGMAFDPLTLLGRVDAVIISPGVPIDSPLAVQAKRLNLPCIGELEFASRFVRGKLIALTGTNGKTTTVSLLGEIFKQAGKVVHAAGNIGFPLSAAVLQAGEEDVFVVEVSSFQMESSDSFHPDIAGILNITPDHLNRHKTLDNYRKLKQKIFINQTAHDIAVLNHDSDILRDMAPEIAGQIAWFSRRGELSQGAFLRDGLIVFRWQGSEQAICPAAELRIPGEHNLENALAAVAVAGAAGVPGAVIRHSLRSFAGVEHRIEFVRELEGVRYINDSKGTNPDATIRAVEAMTLPTILLAGGFDKGVSFDSLAQSIAMSRHIREVVLFGQTAPQIDRALRAAGYSSIAAADNMIQACDLARGHAGPGFNVLLSPACASFDQFTDYEQRGAIFKAHVSGYEPLKGAINAGS